MSVTVEISNIENLRRLKNMLGARDDSEAVEISIEKTIRDFEPVIEEAKEHNLPEEYWDDLFSSPQLPKGRAIKAVLDDREDARY
jgi:hypothetical protein